MLRPPYLQAGDKVALISPAGTIAPECIEYAEKILCSWGLIPVRGRYATSRHDDFAGSDYERLQDMQWAMDEEEIRAIFCNSGGYGCLRIIEKLDYSLFQGNPKWFIGCQEISIFHSQINELGMESLYAPMLCAYPHLTEAALERIKGFLFGSISSYKIEKNALAAPGIVEAELTGGDIRIIHHLQSTTIQHDLKGTVLFLDSTYNSLETEKIIRYMKLSKIFQHLRGLILCNKGIQANIQLTQLIQEITGIYDYPVYTGIPASDHPDSHPIILGSNIRFAVNESDIEIDFL